MGDTSSVYVSLDGIAYRTTNNSDWSDLMATLPPSLAQVYTWAAPVSGWMRPSFQRLGDFVFLRGLVGRQPNIEPADPDVAPMIGRLPIGMRPHFPVDFPTIAHEGSRVHHVTVNKDGRISVTFSAGERYISLDGMAFSVRSNDLKMGSWRLATDNGFNLFLQPQAYGFAAALLSDTAVRMRDYKTPAPATWNHNTGREGACAQANRLWLEPHRCVPSPRIPPSAAQG